MALLLRLIIPLAILYLAFAGIMYVFQRNFLYFPDTNTPEISDYKLDGVYDVVNVRTADGLTLHGWYHAPDRDDYPVIIYFHGNGGNFSSRSFLVTSYIEAGYGVLLAEYRGYGGNPGSPSEKGLYIDADAWINLLINNFNKSYQDIVLFGESLGTGVSVEMAVRYNVRAVILQSPYTSIVDLAQSQYPILPADMLLLDKYDSLSKIEDVHAPLLIVHGAKDRVVPIRYGKELFARANQDRKFLEIREAGHNDLFEYGIANAVIDFLQEIDSQ